MGASLSYAKSGFDLYYHPDVTPNPLREPSNDPSDGFPFQRKERCTSATLDEMKSAKLPLKDRDYCAHFLIDYLCCRKDYFPFVALCSHEKHEYLNCQYEDFVLRMKEYERERRLMLDDEDKEE